MKTIFQCFYYLIIRIHQFFKVYDVLHWVYIFYIPIFSVAPSVRFWQVMFEYNLYHIYFLLLLANFIYISIFFVTVIIEWCVCWYCDNEGSFEISLKAEFTSPLYVTSLLQKTLKQNHCTSHNCCSVKTMLKLLAFKLLLNQLLFEKEWKSGGLPQLNSLDLFLNSLF